jgi:hypothetical protein
MAKKATKSKCRYTVTMSGESSSSNKVKLARACCFVCTSDCDTRHRAFIEETSLSKTAIDQAVECDPDLCIPQPRMDYFPRTSHKRKISSEAQQCIDMPTN